ncbi:MAG: efflux RND transporter periplasmic adaptor subunit [Mangrovibacterium sp.]
MKQHIIIATMLWASATACSNNSGSSADAHEEHKTHSTETLTLSTMQQEALQLEVGTFQMRNLTTVVKTNGELVVPPKANTALAPLIGGNVKEICVFDGDRVKKGQTLAVLEHPDYISLQENFVESANKLDFLKLEYERQEELYKNKVGSGKEFQEIASQYHSEKAKYEGLKARLSLLHISTNDALQGIITTTSPILSPMDGKVNEVNVKLGEYVSNEDVLFRIADNSQIHADFTIYEQDVPLIKVGQEVYFRVGNSSQELRATLFAINPKFDPNTRSIRVHAKLNQAITNEMPGMFVSGRIRTDTNDVRTLPNDAIVSEGTKSYIFTVENKLLAEIQPIAAHANELKFKMTEVVAGKEDDGYTEVKLLTPMPDNTPIVLNAAYYLLADLKKEETEHED